MAPLLELNDVSARYGQVAALHGISLTVDEGEIVALLGAAGKTTTLRAVSGMVRRSGEVIVGGKRLRGAGPESVARSGVAHVPEGRGIFSELTVWENLRMGAYMRRGRPDFKTVLDYFPWLDARRNQQAGTLSGGEQQMLALARAFLQRPRLLMLDEPSLGLAPLITREVFRVVGDLNQKEGLAVLVVEQNAAIALSSAHRAYVLETGSIALSGAAADLKANDAIRSAYLGY
jgi:branched-chain amino acid transport system ATP-binding protein